MNIITTCILSNFEINRGENEWSMDRPDFAHGLQFENPCARLFKFVYAKNISLKFHNMIFPIYNILYTVNLNGHFALETVFTTSHHATFQGCFSASNLP